MRAYLIRHYRYKNNKHEATRLRTVDPVPLLALFELHQRSDEEMQSMSNGTLLFSQVSSHNYEHDIGQCIDQLEMPAGRLGGAQGRV